MPNTTLGMMDIAEFAERLRAAMDERISALGITLVAVSQGIGKDDQARQLRAWRGGSNMPSFTEVLRLDEYFAIRGQPGLIADICAGPAWICEKRRVVAEELPPIAHKLLDCAGGMADAPSLQEFLAERGLLQHVHIMLRSDDQKVRIIHRGTKMKSARHFDPAVFVKDIRELEPHGYGQRVYPQVMESLQNRRPTLHHISSESVDYRRLGVPVRDFWVCHSMDVNFAPNFLLR